MDSFDVSGKEENVFEINENLQLIAYESEVNVEEGCIFYLMSDEEYITFSSIEDFVYEVKESVGCYSISDDGAVIYVTDEEFAMIKSAVELIKGQN